ncbi:MAG: Zn-dependent hydrolase of the beta-lactamase fold-like protein [Candidatus Peregrinibacteria bacterium GW2011_GWA2_47_7]|nr:MAG: Zn-dependent hydrolase of the beta-lactamase fold-like protein [Candidatus Peregrinibacteria bacterium GW2011_GWA2_47_7]
MDIQWHGLSCVSFKSKNATLVTDPYDSKIAGIKIQKLTADVCLSNADFPLHHAVEQLGKDVKVFDWPGEYESKGIIVQCIAAYDRPIEKDGGKDDKAQHVIIYSIKIDGFSVCHLSNIGHRLTSEMLEVIGNVDILLVPIGGAGCLDAKKAHEVVEQVDPRIVIPMYYKIPGLKLPLAELSPFLKEIGMATPSAEKTLKFQSASGLPQENTEFKVLEPVLG